MAEISFSEGFMVVIEVEGGGGKVFSNFKLEKYNCHFSSLFFSILFYCDLTTAGMVTTANSDL